MKRCAFLLMLMLSVLTARSQYIPSVQPPKYDTYLHWGGAFQHLDVALSLGTSGIGIDVATPLCDWAQLRLGYEFMPPFTKSFSVPIYAGQNNEDFEAMRDYIYNKYYYKMPKFVEMEGDISMNNLKLLVDIYPLPDNKKLRATVGFYYGTSKIATIATDGSAKEALSYITLFNKLFETVDDGDARLDMGVAGLYWGKFDKDITDGDGEVIHKQGDSYLMQPASDNTVNIPVKTNAFKPYLGVGYEFGLQKKKDKDVWKLSIDAGAMFWGGTPSMYTPDGFNLTKDITDIPGKKADKIKLVKKLKIYPVIGVRLVRNIF